MIIINLLKIASLGDKNMRVHFKLSLYNLSVIARQLVVEAIQCKRCILDCFVYFDYAQ